MASFSDFMSGIGKLPEQIAAEFAGSNYGKTIYPGRDALVKELNQTIASNTKLSSDLLDYQVQKSVRENLQAMNISNAEELAKNVHTSSYQKDIDGLTETISKFGKEDKASAIVDVMKDEAKDIIDAGLNPNTLNLNPVQKAMKYPQAYFSHPDKKIKNTRIQTAVAAYAGVAVGGRYLSGGTLTTDNYGRKDIAGVPLL